MSASQIFKTGVSVENDDLEVLLKVPQTVESSESHPHMVVSLLLGVVCLLSQVLPTHQVVLLGAETSIFDEVAENTLEGDDDERPIHHCHPPFEEVTVRPFVVFHCRRQKVHVRLLSRILHLSCFSTRHLLRKESIRRRSLLLLHISLQTERLSQICHWVLGSYGVCDHWLFHRLWALGVFWCLDHINSWTAEALYFATFFVLFVHQFGKIITLIGLGNFRSIKSLQHLLLLR